MRRYQSVTGWDHIAGAVSDGFGSLGSGFSSPRAQVLSDDLPGTIGPSVLENEREACRKTKTMLPNTPLYFQIRLAARKR